MIRSDGRGLWVAWQKKSVLEMMAENNWCPCKDVPVLIGKWNKCCGCTKTHSYNSWVIQSTLEAFPKASETIYWIFVVADFDAWNDKVTFPTKSYQLTCCYSVWSPNQQFPDWSDWLDPLLTTHLPLFLSSLRNLTDIITYQDSSRKNPWTSITLQRTFARGRDEEEHIVSSWDDVLWKINHGIHFNFNNDYECCLYYF